MFKKLSLAVSAALVSTSVMALGTAVTPDVEMFVSGASAQDKAIAALFSDLCVAGTLDTYKDAGSKPGKAHTAYFCNIDSTKVIGGTSTVNPAVLFHKRSAGGSAQGVNPVIDEVAIEAMVINNANCAPGLDANNNVIPNEFHCTTVKADGDLVDVISDAGVSDVNPEMFKGVNTPANNLPVDPTVVAAKMEVRGAAALVFGIPVTTALRNALQEAEFGVGNACVGLDTEACMPTLSKSQVASIMTGQVANWSSFNYNGTPLTSIATTVPANTLVHVCRRVNGSGTQAQMNAKFLNNPCTDGAGAPATEPGNPFGGPVIIENSGSSDMTQCLNDLANGTNTSAEFSAFPLLPRVAWAVGIQSTEKNADLADNFRFVKIEGYAPTLENAAKGRYMDVVEQTFQWRKAGLNLLAGDKLNIMDTIATNASDPVILAGATLNQKFNHVWGQAGYLALTTNGFTTSIPFSATNPVTPYTHTVGGGLNNCRTPVVTTAAPASEL